MNRHTDTATETATRPSRVDGLLAAEHTGGYDTDGPDHASQVEPADSTADQQPPFGLPVLAELPELAGMLTALHQGDRRLVEASLLLADLLASDHVAHHTGVPVEQWIGIVAAQTRMDRRLLMRLARLFDRLPALRTAAEAGQVSFAQLRAVAIAARSLPGSLDSQVNDYLAAALPQLEGSDPDTLGKQVTRLLDELQPDELDQTERAARRSLHIQPWLDGTGGSITGALDTIGLAILDEATAPLPTQLRDARPLDELRAQNLLEWLTHSCPEPTTSDADGSGASDSVDGDGDGGRDDSAADGASSGGSSADNVGGDGDGAAGFVDLDSPTGLADGEPVPAGRTGDDGRLPPPVLLLRMELDALLDESRTPADVLTRLIGGRLRLSSDAARRLLDQRGAQLRTVIVDDGHVVGVGRRQRHSPGWLTETTLALHDTCIGPLCDRPARGAHADHAVPWTPQRPGDQPGRTDVDEIGPLCPSTNLEKERAGWRATQTADGRRTWTHPATGLTVDAVPSHWRPPGHDPPPRRPPRNAPTCRRRSGSDRQGGSDPPSEGTDPPSGKRPTPVDDDPLPF